MSEDLTFQQIGSPGRAILQDRGSKFIAYCMPVSDEGEIQAELLNLRAKYPDATHICYAWRMNPARISEYSSDDGEPSGSAGLPVLNQLRSLNIIQSLCAVVRYYGGTNLGKPGLIRAYGTCAREAIECAWLKPLIRVSEYRIAYDYPQTKMINQILLACEARAEESEYVTRIVQRIRVRSENSELFEQKIGGLAYLGIELSKLENGFR